MTTVTEAERLTLLPLWKEAMRRALGAAREFMGATRPNPPVGATILDVEGRVIALRAHERAGELHAEANAIEDCRRQGIMERAHTLVATLEPCNHHGRTPPCTDAIIRSGIRRVIFGSRDPNPKVTGRGAERLREAGIEVVEGVLEAECEDLIGGWRMRIMRGIPRITIKTALDRGGRMIPPAGQKTFASQASLRFAHELRRRSDVIVTGSGTVLADRPEFTVRHVPDHRTARRWLAILDRRGRVDSKYIAEAQARGFDVLLTESDLEEVLQRLAQNGAQEVLIECGPTLTESIIASGLWHRHVVIQQGAPGEPDRIEERRKG